MKNSALLLCFILWSSYSKSQDSTFTTSPQDTSTILKNHYGWLMDDDPKYNKKITWVFPAARVIMTNVVVWSIDRYVLDKSYSHISTDTWKENFKHGWEWDNDKFGVNFIGHPLSGTLYFNAARSNGFNYYQSLPFVVGGSIIWEYLGENTKPSYNDLINTTVSGSFLGEIMYRFSSKILNDKVRGGNRVFREISAGVFNPVRGINRVIRGQTFRTTPYDVYQKEPLNVTLMGGVHYVNNGQQFASGSAIPMINFQLDYGDPFEIRSRKPFDVFRLRVDLSQGSQMKLPNFVNGYGLLAGRNYKNRKSNVLAGGLQHYDIWNNKHFQLGTIGIGGGFISKTNLGKESDFYLSLHVAGVPLAGVNTQQGEDTAKYRNYNYGGGFQGKLESTLNITKWMSLSLNGYYYWIHTYVGQLGVPSPQNSLAGIVKPKLSIWFTRNLSVGMEQFWYFTNALPHDNMTMQRNWTEQKFFVQLFLENPRRAGSRYF